MNKKEFTQEITNEEKSIYHYRLSSTHHSSDRYGKCAVCGKHASEVFCQSEQREFFSPISNNIALTYANCKSHTFGHEECLLKLRR